MKNNYYIKKQKKDWIVLIMLFCGLFTNTVMAQVTNTNYHWGGTVDNSWSNINNWSKTGRYVHTADYASGSTTVTIVTANLQGAVPTTVLAAGHAIVGPGIPANTTVTAFSATPASGVTITLSQATTAAGSAAIIQTYLKSTTLPSATTGNSTLGTTSTVIIDNATLGNPVITTNPAASNIFMRNQFGPSSGTTLTINSGASLTVNHYAASPVSLAGGNIVNNGTLSITSTSTGASTGISCIVPTVLPTVATEYGYSGSGALNINLSASTTANSAAINVTALNANTTYKMLFDGATTISLGSTATAFALRTVGGANSSPLIIGGAGFTMGTAGSPVNGGLLSLGNQSSVTVNSGTTITLNSASTNNTRMITSFSGSTVATNFTNKGTINILGASKQSALFFSTGANASAIPFNITNEGILNVNMNISGAALGALTTGNGGGLGATGTAVNINNSGTLTLKNTSTATGTGFAIFGSPEGEAPPVIVTNGGSFNLEGSVASFGSKVSILNTGTLNSNSDLKSFAAITNNTGATINFVKTAATATSKLVAFNAATTATASAGATFSLGGNTYTVISPKYNASWSTTLYTIVSSSADTSALSESGTLTYVSGTASGNITYGPTAAVVGPPAVEAIAPFSATLVSGALSSGTTNSGTINTDTASNLNIIQGVTAASTGTIAPGGDSGKGIADFSNASTLAIKSTLKLQISGSATAGIDYDQIINSAVGGGFDISAATIDVSGIYAPSGYTVLDIVKTNASGTLTGTFASVVGLGSEWSVVYNSGTAGTVQLVYEVSGPPTITKLSSNGTTTITSACAGSTLVIQGTKFTGTTGVTVNGVALTGVRIISSTRIEAVLPAEATAGIVTVTNGSGSASSAGSFSVIANTINVNAVSACDTYTWAHNGQTYTTSGTYTGTTTNCVTEQLNLIITNSSTITIVENICGTSYVWPSNGVTYVASGSYTIPVGCTTETLQLTLTPVVTPTFDNVASICTGGSLAALPTASNNGIAGTWSPALNNAATTTYTFTPAAGQCATTATMTITVNELTTTGSVTASICAGSTYRWDANNTDYTTAQTGLTHTVGCNTATLNLTITPSPNAGTNGTLSVTAAPTDADLFAALTGADAGGSWTRPSSGYAGIYTYSVNATSPCTVNSTATVTVTAATVLPIADTTFNLCTGAKVSALVAATGIGVKAYAAVTGGVALGDDALKGTTAKPGVYFLTEPTANGESATRVRVYVIINALPAKPSALVLTNDNAVAPTTAVTALGLYAGTNTPFKLTATAAGALSYIWTLPSGVERTNSTGTITDSNATSTDASIYVKFTGTGSATPLVINVQSVNASGCISDVKASASLTRLLPTAPTALALNNGENTTAITSFAKYMGSATVFRLSATASVTATSYLWELPTGVNRMTALEGGSSTLDLTSIEPFIYVNFAGVTKDNTDTNTAVAVLTKVLRIGVKSVNGVGSSTTVNSGLLSVAKLLTLTAVAPAAPSSLAMNNGLNTTAITVISKMIGQGATVKLLAPISVLASSYAWELPSCVTRVNDLAGSIVDNTSTSTDPFIYVKFNGTNPAAGSIYFGVTAVNSVGSSVTVNSGLLSTAKLLKLATAVPAAPASLAMNNGFNTTAITVISKMIGQGETVKLLAPTSVLANSYAWELPSCVTRVTDLAGSIVDNTSTSTDPFIYVKFNGTNPAAGLIYFGVTAVNGVGSSVTVNSGLLSTAKLLKLATVVPAAPSTLVLNEMNSATAVTVVSKYVGSGTTLKLIAAASVLANTYSWELPSCVTRVTDLAGLTADNLSTSTDPFIYVKFNGTTPVAGSIYFGVKAVNSVGSSITANTGTTSTRTDKLLTVTGGLPAVVSTVSGSLSVCNRAEGFSYTITAPVGATSYTITAPAGSVVRSTSVPNNTSNVLTTSDLTFKVVYEGTAAFATTDKSLVIRSANAFGPCLTAKSITLTKQSNCTGLVSTVRLAASSVTEEFNVIAYPNPSSDVFTFEVQSSGKTKATTGVQVYDMIGRLIEQRQVESNSVELGNNYPTGVYNVIVNQAENTKTLRVIKK